MNSIGNAFRSPRLIVIPDDDDEEETMNKYNQQQSKEQQRLYTCNVCREKFSTFLALVGHHYQNLVSKMTASSHSEGCFNQETQQGSDSKSKIHLPQQPDYIMMELPKPTTSTTIESQPVTIRMKVENPESGNVGLDGSKANVPRPNATMTQSQTQPALKKTKFNNPERETIDLNVGSEANRTTNHPGGIYIVKRDPNDEKIDLTLRL